MSFDAVGKIVSLFKNKSYLSIQDKMFLTNIKLISLELFSLSRQMNEKCIENYSKLSSVNRGAVRAHTGRVQDLGC